MNEEAVDSSYVCVYDLETQSTIASVPGRRREDQIGNLQISVLCAVTIPTRLAMDPLRSEEAMANAARHTFWRDDNSNPLGPFEKLLQLFDNADLICGYNISGFDNIVMKKHYAGRRDRYYSHALKMHDCFCRIKDATGVWFKLDALLKANGLETKTADGLEAIKMWQRGERDRLADYCLTDTLQCARLMLRKEIDLPGLDDQSVVAQHVEHLHHVGVADPRHRVGLADQTRQVLGRAAATIPQHLDRHWPIQVAVVGFHHDSQPARAEHPSELVTTAQHHCHARSLTGLQLAQCLASASSRGQAIRDHQRRGRCETSVFADR